jgi:GNAT superfamily N-acetyltransferase
MPLLDTANSLIGKSRKPTNESFLPVGHIGLNSEYETPDHDEDIEGLYWISNFYVSTSLQGSGLGRAAMDAVEETAIAEPLNAKVLALSSVTRENKDHKEKWTALGREPPKITNQDWYERRGYMPYKYVNDLWWESDKTGKRWPHSAVFMKKVIA